MAHYELILFDFDGTLADSLYFGLAQYNLLAVEYGFLPITDLDAARQMKTKAFFKAHKIPLRRLPKLFKEFTRLQRANMPNVRLYEGMNRVLYRLAQHHRLGILSSNTEENIRTCLRINDVESLFSFVLSHSSVFGKHRSMRKIMKSHRLSREQVLYIGDEIRDMKAATKARIDAAAVTWGIHTERVLSAEGPRFVARRPEDLLTMLDYDPFQPAREQSGTFSI